MLTKCPDCQGEVDSTFVLCPRCGKNFDASADSWIDRTYRPIRELGRGGMGSVLLAEDVHLRRLVAIKLLLDPTESMRPNSALLQSEARALAAVRHPHVVSVYTFGVHRSRPYIAMEFIDGMNLGEIIEEHAKHDTVVPLGRAMTILECIASGLNAIHRAGVVHRDVKPSNIMVENRTGRSVLVDFGIAARGGSSGAEVAGTPSYMAPELLFRDETMPISGQAADVFAFAVTAYELLSGRLPIDGESLKSLMFEKAKGEWQPLASIFKHLAAFDSVFSTAFARDPARRFASLDDFMTALRGALLIAEAGISDALAGLRRGEGPKADSRFFVLAVDDDDSFRRLAMRAVQIAMFGKNIRVEGARSGLDALRVCDSPPHLLVLDYDLPGLDGIETLTRLRAKPGAERMRVIVVSGRAGADEQWRFRVLGVEEFVRKPVDFQFLVHAINAMTQSVGLDTAGQEQSISDE